MADEPRFHVNLPLNEANYRALVKLQDGVPRAVALATMEELKALKQEGILPGKVTDHLYVERIYESGDDFETSRTFHPDDADDILEDIYDAYTKENPDTPHNIARPMDEMPPETALKTLHLVALVSDQEGEFNLAANHTTITVAIAQADLVPEDLWDMDPD